MSVIFFTHAYPPLKYPRAIQVSRLVKYSSHQIRVACCQESSPVDSSLLANDGGKAAEKLMFERRYLFDHKRLSNLLDGSYFYEFLQLPDLYRPWALKTASQLIRDRVVGARDVLVTFGQPMSDHLAGLRLKRVVGMPWIAHFSDPWADSPYRYQKPLSHWLNGKMERRVVQNADRIIFTSQETLDLVMRKYPREWVSKARVLPHCFDPELFPDDQSRDSGITLRYLGGFYKPRTPNSLIQALVRLHQERPAILHDVRIELIGTIANDVELIDAYRDLPSGVLAFRPAVDYAKSLALMGSAAALLVIDAPFDESVFLPSKLVDYLGARRPIFAISPPGASAELVTRLGGLVANPNDVGDIAAKLARLIEYSRATVGTDVEESDEVRSQYSAAAVTARFDAIVDELMMC